MDSTGLIVLGHLNTLLAQIIFRSSYPTLFHLGSSDSTPENTCARYRQMTRTGSKGWDNLSIYDMKGTMMAASALVSGDL